MKINSVKDLKEFLATLPPEADNWGVIFDDQDGGLTEIGKVTHGQWSQDSDEVPEGCKPGSSFLLFS